MKFKEFIRKKKKHCSFELFRKRKNFDREPGDEQTTTCACDDHDLPRVASP